MNWLKDVVLVSAMMGCIQWLLPDGVYEKYLKYIISLLTLAVILTPLMDHKTAAAAVELPVGAVAPYQRNDGIDAGTTLDTLQTYQIQEIVKDKIRKEICTLLKNVVSGITEDDIEVYIEHKSLNDGGMETCLITIETSEWNRSDEIRSLLEEQLDLNGVILSIRKKAEE